ncbi:hypothetical protein ACQRXC_26395 (plasmid) [Niallia taxi]|uniref:Uncharacterized protein n=1 Tax=Niallia taxi TaxID=2499688 RepID=A0A437K841_9BACI|nr:hypothetical protein [Niallia taxi]RVT60166.1 hypothetical protein EM808_17105 [Niallia taxi]
MKKISLIATSLLLGASFLVSPITPAHAASSDIVMDSENVFTTPIEKDFKSYPTSTPGSVSTLAVDYSGTYYQMATKKTYHNIDWSGSFSNGGKKDNSVSRKVTRTKFSSGKIGGEFETAVNWKLIQGKIGINGEKAWGKTDTVEVSLTWTIEGGTKTSIEYGSSAVKTTGSIVKYNRGKLIKSTPVDAKYTYEEYSKKQLKNSELEIKLNAKKDFFIKLYSNYLRFNTSRL